MKFPVVLHTPETSGLVNCAQKVNRFRRDVASAWGSSSRGDVEPELASPRAGQGGRKGGGEAGSAEKKSLVCDLGVRGRREWEKLGSG